MLATQPSIRYDAVVVAPFGKLGIRLERESLLGIDFVGKSVRLHAPKDSLACDVCDQLDVYFTNPRHRFSLPLRLHGTDYQHRVWRALRRIPPGHVLSYGQLAQGIHSGARAVGNACRANPVPIIVPCHRVVAAQGRGGYMGATAGSAMRLKSWLLRHEHG